LEKLGVSKIGDLLFHLPYRYQDHTRVVALNHIRPGDECLVIGEIQGATVGYGRRRSLLITIADGRGLLSLRFFHFAKSQQTKLHVGVHIRCYGEVRFGPKGYEMVHPEYQVFENSPPELIAELTPVYRTTEGLGQVRLRKLCQQACEILAEDKLAFRNADAFLQLHAPPTDITPQGLETLQEELAFEE
jgi:ATP-dependent DNA helicase RecG